MSKKKTKHNLPGTIYKNGKRYWWKVKLPGEDKVKARPLVPAGAKMATTDYQVAIECAKLLLANSVFNTKQPDISNISNIAQLCCAYLNHARQYYRLNPNGEPKKIEYSVRPLLKLYSALDVDSFGPLRLIEVRDEMLKYGWERKVINRRISSIKRMFKWAVSQQLISAMLYHGLATVEGLKFGRCTARESEPVKPIEEEYVYKVLPYANPIIRAIIQIQLLTGMRPTEVLQIKPKDVDRTGEIWHYYPQSHKNVYRGHQRVVPLGPQSQNILSPFLLRDDDSYCFCPAESRKYFTNFDKDSSSCNIVIYDPKDNRAFSYKSYGHAVRRAINAARKDIKSKGGNPDLEMPKWTPYQLRHTAATKARKLFNYETAGALLGHSNMSATAIYAERNQGLADEVARRIG
jgi:integrase